MKKSTAKLQLTDNLAVHLTLRNYLWWTSPTSLHNEEAFVLKQPLSVCVISLMELLVSNVAIRILVPYEFWFVRKNLGPLIEFFHHYAFSSLGTCHSFAEPSFRNTSVEEQTTIEKYMTNFGPRTKPVTWRTQGTSVTTFRYYFNFSHVKGKTWRKAQERNILFLYWSCLGWKYWWSASGPWSDNSVATFHSSDHLPLQYQCIYLVTLCALDVSR
jgi:hypothetical protein